MSDHHLQRVINNKPQAIRFSNFPLINKRSPYDIELLRCRDDKGQLSSEIVYPENHTIEWALLEFVKTGNIEYLERHNLTITESPDNQVISRNLTLLDEENSHMYVIGSVGLVRFCSSSQSLTLEDPVLDNSFHKYQTAHGRNPGGVMYFGEDGVKSEDNATPLGVSYIETGPYSLLKKIEKTRRVEEAGINTPEYLFAGRIKNIGAGEWGFSIYRSPIQPDYLKNLKLFIENDLSFTENYSQYLIKKYRQLRVIHSDLACSHGQPTIENAGFILSYNEQTSAIEGDCIIKDMDTLKDLPSSEQKTIIEGPCPQHIGINIKKSPHVAGQTYDLQLALTQELNILLIATQAIKDPQTKLRFVQEKFAQIMKQVCVGYGLNNEQSIPHIITFCLKHFINGLKRGVPFQEFNYVLGGLAANAIFGFSANYKNQIEVIPE